MPVTSQVIGPNSIDDRSIHMAGHLFRVLGVLSPYKNLPNRASSSPLNPNSPFPLGTKAVGTDESTTGCVWRRSHMWYVISHWIHPK